MKIYANTLSSIGSVWGAELAQKNVELVEYGDFEDYLRNLFPVLPDDEVGEEEGSLPLDRLFDKAYEAYRRHDYDTSFPIFMRLAESGFAKAFGYVGLAYELGEGVEYDMEKAISYYRKAIDAHDYLGVYRLGMHYRSEGRNEQAYALYAGAVKDGFATPDAHLNLAEMLEGGIGVRRDLQQAIVHYRAVLPSGDPFDSRKAREALERLGVLYSAEDFDVQLPEEYQVFSPDKLYSLGEKFRDDFQKPDVPLAFACLRLAADRGHAVAASAVSALYSSQKYPIHDDEQARKYSRLASDGMVDQVESNPRYAYDAGRAFEQGAGCEKNEEKSIRCYLVGVGEKDKDCEWRLAGIYQRNGRLEEAFRLFLDAANHGQGMAMFEVAQCFERGMGTARNMEKAIHWYEQCAKSTYAAAHEAEWRLKKLKPRSPASTSVPDPVSDQLSGHR